MAGAVGIGTGIGGGSNLLLNKIINKYDNEISNRLEKDYNYYINKESNRYKKALDKAESEYGKLSDAFKNKKNEIFVIHANNMDNIVTDKNESLTNLEKKVKKLKTKGKIGSGVLGIGLGTYYLINKKKKRDDRN